MEDTPEVIRECLVLGIDPTKVGGRRQLPDLENDPVPLWPDMVDGYALFLSMDTQWNLAGAGLAGSFRTGLRYEAIGPTATGLNITVTPRVFMDLQTLEGEALRTWSARRGNKR